MSPRQLNVLVVDDEPVVCSLIRDGLEASGLQCMTATQPKRAKQLLDTVPVSVLVSDISMPEVSGLDLLAHARHKNPSCTVILITGVPTVQSLAEALSLGAYDYIQKPFNMPRLVETIRRAADDAQGINELSLRAARAMQLESQFLRVSLESIHALVDAVEAKDPYTRRHSEHVAHYATCLAEHIALPEETIESLRVASLLHDVGKIAIPDHILTKPGALTPAEFEQIRAHPVVGAEILQNISHLAEEAMFVRHHHERWDGTGYPDGLTGEESPFGARMINIADSIDAMLMARTYKQAYPIGKMLDELLRCAGKQFDPNLARAAVDWCEKHSDQLVVMDEVDA